MPSSRTGLRGWCDVTHSVELLLDERTEATILDMWRVLGEAGIPSAAAIRSSTNRPHVTLLAAGRIDPAVDGELMELSDRLPIRCVIGAPLVFGTGRFTLTRMVVASAHLLALHADVYERCLPHLSAEPFPHSAPGQWVPHVTLGRRLMSVQVGEALGVREVTVPELVGHVVGLRRWDGDQRAEYLMTS